MVCNEPVLTRSRRPSPVYHIYYLAITTSRHRDQGNVLSGRLNETEEFDLAGSLGGVATGRFHLRCAGTSCTHDKLFGVPPPARLILVQMFDSEYEAFRKYCETYPDNALLLVDTYDTLKSGIPNAIKAFNEVLKPLGKRPKGVRLDSGDIAYQSKKAREMLDKAGYPDCKIFASSSLDEYLIRDLLYQGAKIDAFGVGERLITSKSSPVFDGVYKLCAVEIDGTIVPRIKISENVEKITIPHFKGIPPI